jgi:hypothetical protein
MKRLATALFVLAGLAVASSALAVDFDHKTVMPQNTDLEFTLVAVLACDNGNANSAYYQLNTSRYGNLFSFGSGARLSALAFAHYGFGFAGPYNYDIELWDPTSCTPVAAVNGLVAQDAANDLVVETVDLCPQQLTVQGNLIVAIDANSCASPSDCYPDVIFDNQINVACPWIVDAATNTCYDVSDQNGPFILRVEIDNCPVPVVPGTWGALKQRYR